MQLSSYPSIYNIGHAAVRDLLPGDVIVEEKVDGSQFSFGVHRHSETGEEELLCRSKGALLHLDAPTKMFAAGVEAVKEMRSQLTIGYTYRGEYLGKPKHNTLAYDRTPEKHVILFDIGTGVESYLSPEDKKAEGARLGLEVVPALFVGRVETAETFRALLNNTSVLGGQKIEGVVVKPRNYDIFGIDKKVLFAKYVSEAFKEIHGGAWKKNNPTSKDIIQQLVDRYRTPARWAKAVQHLREAGVLQDSPRDIGGLLKEVQADVLKEEMRGISEALFNYAWPHVARGIIGGLPQWYKEQLVEKQFEEGGK